MKIKIQKYKNKLITITSYIKAANELEAEKFEEQLRNIQKKMQVGISIIIIIIINISSNNCTIVDISKTREQMPQEIFYSKMELMSWKVMTACFS